MSQVLQQAMRHEMAETFFNEPVDAVALGIPDYHEVIKVGWLQFALAGSGPLRPGAHAVHFSTNVQHPCRSCANPQHQAAHAVKHTAW